MKKTAEIAKGAAVALIAFALLGEMTVRAYTHFFQFYDVEMTRYATELKQATDPRIGHRHLPNKELKLMGVDVHTNSDGFRDQDYAEAKGAKRRILFLGDSLTFGWGVPREETFEYLLENQLASHRPTEVINFGHGNYNTDQEVGLFEKRGLSYSPDAVVLFYFINDAEPTPKRSRWSFLEQSRFVTFFWSRLKAVRARFQPSQSYEGYYSHLYDDEAPGWLATQKALAELSSLCLSKNIDLKVVLLPELHSLNPYPFSKEYKKVGRVLESLHVPYLDLSTRFPFEGETRRLWVAPDDAHPNAQAHQLIAKTSYGFISKEN